MVSDLRIGAQTPDFDLPGIDGKNLVFRPFLTGKAAIVVVFSCNHCPYCVAYEERLLKFQSTYAGKGVAFVRINSDDEQAHTEDTLEEMKKRYGGKGPDFIYLRDKNGETAKAFGAKVMPEAFIVGGDGKIRYAGRIDDCWQSVRRVKRHDLKLALEDILHDRDIAVKTTKPVGCAIKRGGQG